MIVTFSMFGQAALTAFEHWWTDLMWGVRRAHSSQVERGSQSKVTTSASPSTSTKSPADLLLHLGDIFMNERK